MSQTCCLLIRGPSRTRVTLLSHLQTGSSWPGTWPAFRSGTDCDCRMETHLDSRDHRGLYACQSRGRTSPIITQKHKLINCLADEFTQKLSGDTYMEIELEELNYDEEKDQDQSAEED